MYDYRALFSIGVYEIRLQKLLGEMEADLMNMMVGKHRLNAYC
jgi:hypothetical protein